MTMNKRGGKYCCLPGCSNSSCSPNISLFLVANGKHKRSWLGSSADVLRWSQEFCQILYKYREKLDNNFGKRIEDGKVYICSAHFCEGDIQKNVSRSWIKFGKLPTQNMPEKSIKVKETPKRRQLVKYDVPTKVQKKQLYRFLVDISSAFQSLKSFSQWQLNIVYDNESPSTSSATPMTALHFSHWPSAAYMKQGISAHNLLVSRDFSFKISLHGIGVPSSHNIYSMKLMGAESVTIATMLWTVQNYKLCDGYSDCQGPSWVQIFMPSDVASLSDSNVR